MKQNSLILNRYQLRAKAGSGGFATVVAAFDTHLKRNVAIKIIHLDPETAYQLQQSLAPDQYLDNPSTNTLNSVSSDDIPNASADDMRTNPKNNRSATRDITKNNQSPARGTRNARNKQTATFGANDALDGLPQDMVSDLPQATHSRMLNNESKMLDSGLPGLSEAQVAGNLGSSNIVSVYDLQLDGNTAYLIMEYVDGLSLDEFIKRFDNELTLDMIAAIINGVANALKTAHKHKVLHLDIKPANILIDNEGQIKVTDFGMAALPNAQGKHRGQGGTIGYMPPEQMDQEDLDERCDEWALASVLYLLLSGSNPFEAPNIHEAHAAIQNAELLLPSLMWEKLNEDADDVIFYALDPNKEERYESIEDFAEEIIPLLGKPRKGKNQLAELMNPIDEELPEEDLDLPPARKKKFHLPRINLSYRARSIIARIFAGVTTATISSYAAYTMYCALFTTDATTGFFLGIAVTLCTIAAILLPPLGPMCAYGFLGCSLIVCNIPIVGVALIVITLLWCATSILTWHQGKAAANIVLSTPFLGALYLTPLTCISSAYLVSYARTACTTAFCFVISLIFASFGSGSLYMWDPLNHLMLNEQSGMIIDNLCSLLLQASTWLTATSWIVAALVLSWFNRFERRWLAILGNCLATALLITGLIASELMKSGGTNLVPDTSALASICVCVVLGFLYCFVQTGIIHKNELDNENL